MRPLRLHFTGLKGVPATYGGVERAVEEIGARLAARGHEVTVHCRDYYTPTALTEHRGMRLLRERTLRTKRLDTLSHAWVAMVRACRERPDVIGLHNYPNGPLAWIARAQRVPVVLHLHGFEWGLGKWNRLDKLLLRLVLGPATRAPDALTSVSRAQAEFIARRTGRETRYVPNGVSPPDWIERRETREEALAPSGLAPGGYVLSVSRLVPQKGLEHLVRAYRRLSSPLPLAIVGDHNHAPEYVARLRAEAGDDPRIRLLGYRFGDELWALYANCALFVLPSESEGMPLVLLEAMAARRPIVASDIPEVAEVGGPAVDYFERSDPESLAARMDRLLRSPEAGRALGEAAGSRVREHYTWDRAATAFEDLYRELSERRRLGAGGAPQRAAVGRPSRGAGGGSDSQSPGAGDGARNRRALGGRT